MDHEVIFDCSKKSMADWLIACLVGWLIDRSIDRLIACLLLACLCLEQSAGCDLSQPISGCLQTFTENSLVYSVFLLTLFQLLLVCAPLTLLTVLEVVFLSTTLVLTILHYNALHLLIDWLILIASRMWCVFTDWPSAALWSPASEVGPWDAAPHWAGSDAGVGPAALGEDTQLTTGAGSGELQGAPETHYRP